MTTLIDSRLQAFLESGVAMIAATRDVNNVPAIARAGGCRVVAPDRVTVFVAIEQAARCIDDVRANGHIAVVYVMPHTYECYQVKGIDAHVTPLAAAERMRIAAYRRALFASLCEIRMPESLAAGLLPDEPGAFVGIGFTPSEVFCNTPGPIVGDRRRT